MKRVPWRPGRVESMKTAEYQWGTSSLFFSVSTGKPNFRTVLNTSMPTLWKAGLTFLGLAQDFPTIPAHSLQMAQSLKENAKQYPFKKACLSISKEMSCDFSAFGEECLEVSPRWVSR